MTAKIFKSIVVSAAAVFILTLIVVMGISYGYYSDEILEELKTEAEYIRGGVESFGDEYLYTISSEKTRITRIGADGALIYDSRLTDEETESAQNHLSRKEVAEALADGVGYDKRYSDTIAEQTVYYAVRLSDGTVLRLSSQHPTVFTMLLGVLWPTAILLALVLLCVFLVARWLSHSIVRPINALDLANPDINGVYEELRPIVERLKLQNHRVTRQMNELKNRESELISITSNMSEGMIVMNAYGAVLSSNESAHRIFDIEKMPKSALSINEAQEFRDAILSALSGRNAYYEMQRGERHFTVMITPVVRDDVVEGAVMLAIDDTEKEGREALRREFTSNISHELKTPLTSISGFAELIRCGMAEGEDAKRFAESIYKESQRLITLVGDIIRLSQLDGGEIPYDEGGVDLCLAAREVVDRLSGVAEAAGVSLSFEGGSARIPANAQILEQMIYNLCDNGIKYNERGGYVKVSVTRDGERAVLSVKDNGIGIPKDNQDRIFERFYRVDKSRSKSIGGTGLGLSIVKHAAIYHNAEIRLQSEEGVGTEIKIIF
ncbi:MAG: histidine kinase [Clostridia bacterium]|nr:histidine kinase [Clostridia bacterium]